MPIYEYRCAACGQQGEHLQKISEAPLTKCPKCGKKKYEKLISAAGFQLKGSGWYVTDFRGGKSSGGKDSASAEGGDAKGDAKTETKTETKTEAKTETKSTSESKSDKPAKKKAAASAD